MSRTRLHCPTCGHVVVRTADVTVRAHRYNELSFSCPTCKNVVRRVCSANEAEVLALGGANSIAAAADRSVGQVVADVDETLMDHFVKLLGDEEWVRELMDS